MLIGEYNVTIVFLLVMCADYFVQCRK